MVRLEYDKHFFTTVRDGGFSGVQIVLGSATLLAFEVDKGITKASACNKAMFSNAIGFNGDETRINLFISCCRMLIHELTIYSSDEVLRQKYEDVAEILQLEISKLMDIPLADAIDSVVDRIFKHGSSIPLLNEFRRKSYDGTIHLDGDYISIQQLVGTFLLDTFVHYLQDRLIPNVSNGHLFLKFDDYYAMFEHIKTIRFGIHSNRMNKDDMAKLIGRISQQKKVGAIFPSKTIIISRSKSNNEGPQSRYFTNLSLFFQLVHTIMAGPELCSCSSGDTMYTDDRRKLIIIAKSVMSPIVYHDISYNQLEINGVKPIPGLGICRGINTKRYSPQNTTREDVFVDSEKAMSLFRTFVNIVRTNDDYACERDSEGVKSIVTNLNGGNHFAPPNLPINSFYNGACVCMLMAFADLEKFLSYEHSEEFMQKFKDFFLLWQRVHPYTNTFANKINIGPIGIDTQGRYFCDMKSLASILSQAVHKNSYNHGIVIIRFCELFSLISYPAHVFIERVEDSVGLDAARKRIERIFYANMVEFRQAQSHIYKHYLAEDDTTEMVVDVDDAAADDDDDKIIYCTCQKEEYGNMVQCGNPNCTIEWFHFECVGIERKPRGKWLCSTCDI